MRHRFGSLLVVGAVLATLTAPRCGAQEGTLLRSAVKEAIEVFGAQAEKQGAKQVAEELAAFGGEAAVRETFEQVSKEGGEEGVKNLVRLCKSYGVDAVRAAKVAPRATSTFVADLLAEFVPGALRALARPEEGAVLAKIPAELMPGALEAAARHPGVGAEVVEKLGVAGVRASERSGTDTMIQLARSADSARVAVLPAAERAGLVGRMARFIESHPKSAFGAAALALFVRYKDEILGEKGQIEIGPDGQPVFVPRTGIIERAGNRALSWILPVIAAIVGLWGANKLFWAWRFSKLSHAVKAAGLAEQRKT
jgi:hypothetical protein